MQEKTTIISNDSALQIVENLRKLKIQLKELAKQEEELKQKLYNFMGEHDILVNGETGEELVHWTYSDGFAKFDAKKFLADKPEIYKQYCFRTQPVRTLRITK